MKIGSLVNEYWFQHKKYLDVKEFLVKTEKKLYNRMSLYYKNKVDTSTTKDEQCPLSYAWYAEPSTEYLLVSMQSRVEELTGMKLFPTYSYMRIYNPNEILEWHKDRESCEISVTLNIGQSSEFSWPIGIAPQTDITQRTYIDCQPGDAMIYRGCEVFHWREKFNPPAETDWQAQVFLHYVDRYGPNAHYKFDRREKLFPEQFS